jgi:membrane protein YqaA with SNARE-associated domain
MAIFSKLYDRVMVWAKHRYAALWLGLVSFSESSFFIIPPDVMLAPMSLAQPMKAWFYASLTTITSVLGGLFGYLIGMLAFQAIEPWIVSLGYIEKYDLAVFWFSEWGIWAILLAGFTPIPYKIFTIAAGAANMALIPFVLGSLIGRGARFFLVAGLMKFGGPRFEPYLKQWIDRVGWLVLVLLVVAYFLLH